MNSEVSSVVVDDVNMALCAVHPEKKRRAEADSEKPDIKRRQTADLTKHHSNLELSNLPRFGAKLSAAPADVDCLQWRLDKIYNTKLQAFKWARRREIVLTDGVADGAAKKRAESFTGRLDTMDMSVEMTRFRGTFSSYFGRHFQKDNESRTTLSPFEAFFLIDMGTLEVNVSDGCILAAEDVRAMMEAKVPDFPRRYAVFSELHRSTQLYAKPYGTPPPSAKKSKNQPDKSLFPPSRSKIEIPSPSTKNQALTPKSILLQPPEPIITLPVSKQRSERSRATVEDAKNLLGLEATPPPREAAPLEVSPQMDEIPPFSFTELTCPYRSAVISTSEASPETLDVAFTCYSRISSVGTTTPQFDVALTDFRRQDVPISDLFLALASRRDSSLPLYVAKEDHGQISGFAAVLADIPTVCYQGLSDA